ncbi:MAG: TrpR-like protein, YerC/YecD [Oscillospiraceae bacterium]|nr:TrpR-like protein, YerC/YecD [Oscillospiraceae bacterium]
MNQKSPDSLDLLYEAVLSLETKEECKAFFDDLCTTLELDSISQRLKVARMLKNNCIYKEISAETGASSATISRVRRTLNSGYSGKGFDAVFSRLEKNRDKS